MSKYFTCKNCGKEYIINKVWGEANLCDECILEASKKKKIVSRETSEQIYQPEHYSFGKYECINVIKDISTKQEYEGYLRGNVVKYLWRYRHKNGIEDLMKCRHYLDMLIKEVGNCGDK